MKYSTVVLITILAVASIGLYSVIIDDTHSTDPDGSTIADNEGSIQILWDRAENDLLPDLRLATIAIALILFCGIYATMIILHYEED